MINYRNVLRVYKLERELAPDDVALLNTLREMPDTVREMFAETLGPPVKVKASAKQRKVEHCEVCDHSGRAAVHKDATLSDYHEFQSSKPKSPRAQSLATAIATAIGGQVLDGGVSKMRCAYEVDDNGGLMFCGEYVSNPIHDPAAGYAGYHEFVAPGSQAAGASGD